MKLNEFFDQHRKTRLRLAESLGVTNGALSQWIQGRAKPALDKCIEIEKLTHGEVKCEDLRQDVDWGYLRGTKPRSGKAQAMEKCKE